MFNSSVTKVFSSKKNFFFQELIIKYVFISSTYLINIIYWYANWDKLIFLNMPILNRI